MLAILFAALLTTIGEARAARFGELPLDVRFELGLVARAASRPLARRLLLALLADVRDGLAHEH